LLRGGGPVFIVVLLVVELLCAEETVHLVGDGGVRVVPARGRF
jgi:hypothetical protein